MKRPLLVLSIAAALALSGCRDNPNADLDAHEAVVAKRAAGGVNPGAGRVRMALVAEPAECLEAADRIVRFCREQSR